MFVTFLWMTTLMYLGSSLPDQPHLEIYYIYPERDLYLKCVPRGILDNVTCIQWEHQSEYNEHIRYLGGTGTEHVKVERTSDTSKRFQDNGYYICRVWNGISDVKRSLLAEIYQYIAVGDAPDFMSDNQKFHHGKLGKEVNIMVKIYSKPAPTNATIKSNNKRKRFWTALSNRTIKAFHLLHNSYVSIPVIQLTFRMKLNTTDDFEAYIITVCNSYGCNEFATHILDPTIVIDIQYLQWLPVPLLLLISLVIGIIVTKRNRKKPGVANYTGNVRQNEDIVDEAQVSVAVDNGLYQSVENLNLPAIGAVDGAMSVDTANLPSPTLDDNDRACFHALYSTNRDEKHNRHNVSFTMRSERVHYSEVAFESRHTSATSVIHGIESLEDRTIYSDIDLSIKEVLPESSSASDTDGDYVCIEGV